MRVLGFDGLAARGADALPAVAKLLDDENPFIRARAVWLLARLGPEGIAQVEKLLGSDDAMLRITAYRALRQANRAQSHAAKLARDPSPAVRREVALSQRDVPFEASRDVLLALAAGYDGDDRSYLEAWGIGATHKEEALYAALAASAPRRRCSRLAAQILRSRLATDAASRGERVRHSRTGASRCPRASARRPSRRWVSFPRKNRRRHCSTSRSRASAT